MKRIPELLAPAGSFAGLKFAVQYGADAVYLGAKEFSARKSAANFDIDELARAFDYCHERDVKAYLTLNTLIKDDEFERAYELGCQVAQLGADALILQDMGLVDVFSKHTDIPIHISTQASLCSLYDVLACKERKNVSRVVLARETPLEDISYIKRNCGLELEIFVHGALCVSFSGQCLLSSIAGGRSGNRGGCAQPCRQEYQIYKNDKLLKNGYLLSSKDLCTVDYLEKIVNSGADSLKIEGRLKRPEYVGITVSQYRNALDCISSNSDFDSEWAKKELSSIFNRGGFCKGYYINNKDIIFSQQPNNSGILIGRTISGDGRKIHFDNEIRLGDSIEIRKDGVSLGGGAITSLIQNGQKTDSCQGTATINSINTLKISGFRNVQSLQDSSVYRTGSALQIEYINRGLRSERIKNKLNMHLFCKDNVLYLTANYGDISYTAQTDCRVKDDPTPLRDAIKKSLSKLGDTPFEADKISIDVLDKVFFTLSDINRLRRNAVNGILQNMIVSKHNRYLISALHLLHPECLSDRLNGSLSKFAPDHPPCNVLEVHTPLELYKAITDDKYQEIYFRANDWDFFQNNDIRELLTIHLSDNFKKKIYFALVAGCFEQDYRILERNIEYIKAFSGIVAESLGMIYFAEKYNLDFIAGASLNIFNCYSAEYFTKKNALRLNLSYELNRGQINCISSHFNTEIMLCGRIPAMLLMHCPRLAAGEKCNNCDGEYYLTDKFNHKFPVKRYKFASCRHILYNSNITILTKRVSELQQADVTAFRYVADDLSQCSQNATKGHYLRGVE